MTRRGRSTRSYVVELIFVVVVIAGIWLWMTNGGATAFGQWFAERMGAP